METLELSDIQGYLVRGYKHMMFSRYVMLQITDPNAARSFIALQSENIMSVAGYSATTCLNIAFTAAGLRTLGLSEENVLNFTREFREGMTTPHRQRLLGDFDNNDPIKWLWGGPKNEELHLLLMVFGCDKNTAVDYYGQLKIQYEQAGFKEVFLMDGQTLPGNKEHFGFRDGISQPVIIGSGRESHGDNCIKPGEFIMGYKNEYDVYPDTPIISEKQGAHDMLPLDAAGSHQKDLGRNGTYMVMRQLQQDVTGYWMFLNDKTKNPDGSTNTNESKKLAAKMMGRWPSGAPIVKWPDHDPGETLSGKELSACIDDNDFNYQINDKDGLKCPFGSHLRRTNPRDSFEDNTSRESIKLTNRHRIIRRARLYGEPYEGSPTNFTPCGEVGLMFTCFNADISRQYEFIQYTWANYPKFKQLYNDPDPIIGVRGNPANDTEQNFTIPFEPVNKYIKGLKSFVTMKGGAYFFFPSLTAIKYLTTL